MCESIRRGIRWVGEATASVEPTTLAAAAAVATTPEPATNACVTQPIYSCYAGSAINGVADIPLADAGAAAAGRAQDECQRECTDNLACGRYVHRPADGHCELWSERADDDPGAQPNVAKGSLRCAKICVPASGFRLVASDSGAVFWAARGVICKAGFGVRTPKRLWSGGSIVWPSTGHTENAVSDQEECADMCLQRVGAQLECSGYSYRSSNKMCVHTTVADGASLVANSNGYTSWARRCLPD